MAQGNLYDEIMNLLDEYGYDTSQIISVGVPGVVSFNVDDFLTAAEEINYDGGYGTEQINTGLVMLMWDGCWFERETYDGSEWFAYRKAPTLPTNTISDTTEITAHIVDVGW
jgi:hypothetical protein